MNVKMFNGDPYVQIDQDFYMKLVTVAPELGMQDPLDVIQFAVDIVAKSVEEVSSMPGNAVTKDIKAYTEEIKRKVQIALTRIKNQSNFGGE